MVCTIFALKFITVQTQTQVQVQKLSAQQIMVVKLLELPTVEFEERIHDELIDNPALEEGREVSTDEHEEEQDYEEREGGEDSLHDDQEMNDYLLNDDDEIPAYQLQTHNRSAGEQVREIPFSDSTSFYESVRAQIAEHYFTPQQKKILTDLCSFIPGNCYLHMEGEQADLLLRGRFIDYRINPLLEIVEKTLTSDPLPEVKQVIKLFVLRQNKQ